MRFKKGTKVEVFSKKDDSTVAWYCAEVISGNGHTYSVKYGWFPATDEAVAERVPRKAIRPCPPPVQGMDACLPGNLVEVFHNLAWRTAMILKVIDANYFLVREFGSSKNLQIHKSHLRVRQCWKDNKWFVIGKGTVPVGKRKQFHDDTGLVKKRIQIPRGSVGSTRSLKRKSPNSVVVAAQKKRLVGKDGSHKLICFVSHSPNFEKVDATIYPNEILGENHVHCSSNIPTTEYSRMDESRATNSSLVESSLSVHTDDDCASSVASCSSMCHGGWNSSFSLSRQHSNNLEDYVSDAESTSGDGKENERCLVSADEQLFGVESHRSEFLSYCSTMEDLYDSGPLSWDDEVNLTNLRQMLHISDDEHLMVLKNLIPANSTLIFS